MSSRDAESPMLLVNDQATSRAIGFVVLFETATDRDGSSGVDVRLGYVFAESARGRGSGTELVSGMVDWAREQPAIDSIPGGVRTDNEASARVLPKNGFRPTDSHDGEQMYPHHLD